jgi:hypothetical protein
MDGLKERLEATEPYPVTSWDRMVVNKISQDPKKYVPG